MLPAGRHSEIVRAVRADGLVSVEALAAGLGVSSSTIRRDLRRLDADGLLRRVRGGAGCPPGAEGGAPALGASGWGVTGSGATGSGVDGSGATGSGVDGGAADGSAADGSPSDSGPSDSQEQVPFAQVVGPGNARASADKARIAACAAELIDDGAVVVLDIGTTTAQLAVALRGRPITVITSSLAVVDALRDDSGVELVVLGGLLRRTYHSLVGGLTEQALRTVRAHVAFLGTSGVGRDGMVLDSTSVEVPVKQAMIACAERTVLLADAGKFPGTGVAPVCGADALDVLITSADADRATLAVCAAAGVTVRVA